MYTLDYKHAFEVATPEEIGKCVNQIKDINDNCFVEIRVNKGFRNDLDRPITTPKDNKEALLRFLQ